MIYVSDNVLTPEVLHAMYRHKKSIDSIKTKYNDTWETMCKKMPIVKVPDIVKLIFDERNISNQTGWGDDWDEGDVEFEWKNYKISIQDEKIETAEKYSVQSYPEPYCDIVEGMDTACIEFSLLEFCLLYTSPSPRD